MEAMYSISQLFEMGRIPAKFKGSFNETCRDPHCKFPIVSNMNLTYKMCLNPSCPQHLKHQAAKILKYLGINGVAEKTCEKLILSRNLTTAFDIVPLYFEEKPELFLSEVMQLAYTPGISSKWQDVLQGMDDRSDFSNLPPAYREYIPTIKEACKYFRIKRVVSIISQRIAVHGTLVNYGSRDKFISYCNSIEGILVSTIKKTSITEDTDFLVTDSPNDTSCAKIKAVMEKKKKIPIISPEEYVAGIIALTQVMREELTAI